MQKNQIYSSYIVHSYHPSPYTPVDKMSKNSDNYDVSRRSASDDGSSNQGNSSQTSTTSSSSSTSSKSQSQSSTTPSQSKSTSQSQSPSKEPAQSSTPAPSPSPSNSTSPNNNNNNNNNNDNNKNNSSNNQNQNNTTQAQGQGQSTPSASAPSAVNSTSLQPSPANNSSPSNTFAPNATQTAASGSNPTGTGNTTKPTNSSQTIAPISSGTSFLPSSTSSSGNMNGNLGSGLQQDHQSTSNLSAGTIAGIAIGGAAALILIILLALFCYRKRKDQTGMMAFEDAEKQKGLNVFNKESRRFSRLSGNSPPAYFETSSRRTSAPRLDIHMHQHQVSLESEEDRAASAGLTGIERRSSSLLDFSDQVHIHREPIVGPDNEKSEDEHMEFFFINQGAPELSDLVRKGSSSSISHSPGTIGSLQSIVQHGNQNVINLTQDESHTTQHEGPFDAASNRNSAVYLTEMTKETNTPNTLRNSILSNLSS